ncbi:MAG TPA: hypothetical protein VH247_05245 [Thermoleophilaceae bacterium]|jgi:uncharacterized membrane protein YeaQ/YmgE (transglycosylase-associated protein family)|nr:hypothetical protein [Thermoleophilaceae bacterium]
MSLFVWIMMGIALWHFTVFLPDKFWGGIVGAFLVAIVGAAISGFCLTGFHIIGRHDLTIAAAFEAIPGTIIALALSWYYGRHLEAHPRRRGPRTRRPARA